MRFASIPKISKNYFLVIKVAILTLSILFIVQANAQFESKMNPSIDNLETVLDLLNGDLSCNEGLVRISKLVVRNNVKTRTVIGALEGNATTQNQSNTINIRHCTDPSLGAGSLPPEELEMFCYDQPEADVSRSNFTLFLRRPKLDQNNQRNVSFEVMGTQNYETYAEGQCIAQ